MIHVDHVIHFPKIVNCNCFCLILQHFATFKHVTKMCGSFLTVVSSSRKFLLVQ